MVHDRIGYCNGAQEQGQESTNTDFAAGDTVALACRAWSSFNKRKRRLFFTLSTFCLSFSLFSFRVGAAHPSDDGVTTEESLRSRGSDLQGQS